MSVSVPFPARRAPTRRLGDESRTQAVAPASALCLLLVGLTVMSTQWDAVRVTHTLAVEYVLLPLSLAAVAGDALLRRRRCRVPPLMIAAALGFALVGLLAALFAPAPHLTINPVATQLVQQAGGIATKSRANLSSLAKFELAFIFLPLMIGVTCQTRGQVIRMLDWWAFGAIVSAAIATSDLANLTHVSQSLLGRSTLGREGGLELEANDLAVSASLAVPYVMTWFRRGPRWSCVGILSVVLLCTGIYATRSRGAEVALPLNLLFGVCLNPELRQRLALVGPLLALLAIVTLFSATGDVHNLLYELRLTSNASGVAGSDAERAGIRTYSEAAFMARPLEGVGYTVVDDAHDIYIQLAATGGLLGLGAFAAFLAGLVGMVRRLWGSTDHVLLAGISASIVTWLTMGVVENQLTDPFLYVTAGGLIALTAARDRSVEPAAAG